MYSFHWILSWLSTHRILDPEHREPFITLGGIFAAAGLTPIEGLLRFDLHRGRGHFDVSLAGLEPRDELWVSAFGRGPILPKDSSVRRAD